MGGGRRSRRQRDRPPPGAPHPARSPRRLPIPGDVYPSGTAEDFARNYHPVYGRLAPITWPTPGNHEWWGREQGYFPYWREQGRPARPWYRFSLGGWELLSLNSETPHGAGSPQLRWLDSVVGAAPGTCRLAFWHRPRFSAGTVHGDAPDVAPFWRSLRGHARLVLNGHDHVLMRYRRRAGLTEYVAGAGGRVRYGLRPDRRGIRAVRPNRSPAPDADPWQRDDGVPRRERRAARPKSSRRPADESTFAPRRLPARDRPPRPCYGLDPGRPDRRRPARDAPHLG
jgi:Calcineurin-like phosphoesterase